MTRRTIQAEDAPPAIGPYSHAVEAAGLVFASGQIPLDPASGELVETDIQAQTRQVLHNLEAVLRSAGSDLEHVVKTTVYLTDLRNFAAMNEVYGACFRSQPPARACLEVSALPKGALIEIEVVAVRPA